MLKPATIAVRKLIRKAVVSTLMIAIVGLAFASKGGGGEKKKSNAVPFKNEFVPIRTTNNFTLKSGPSYGGSFILGQEKTKTAIAFNTVVAYERGNTVYILPYKYKVNTSVYMNTSGKTNLQLLDLRIKMHK
ncbi:hypothetical protein ACX0G9_28635 [Flavitalea flava]